MTPHNGERAPGLVKALAGAAFMVLAAGVATFIISSTWDIAEDSPRTVVQVR